MVIVATLYRFTGLEAPEAFRAPLAAACARAGTVGTVTLAREGVNAVVAGTREALAEVLAALRDLPGCGDLTWTESSAPALPFARMKVQIRSELVAMGRPGLDPDASGRYVAPTEWNTLIDAPDVALIDTRNDYETAIGSFPGAVHPATQCFRDFPGWWDANAARFAGRRVAMFCTGGIRCEKATAYLRHRGVHEVHQLRGGILNYLATAPPDKNRWQGECFVFDRRVAVTPDLGQGSHEICPGCRRPISHADKTAIHRCTVF